MKPLKEVILKYLQENKGKRFTCRELSKALNISYMTILKWIEVLSVENKIKVLDYGNLKQVWLDDIPSNQTTGMGHDTQSNQN